MDEGGPFKLVEVPARAGDHWEATFEKDGRRVRRHRSEDQSRELLRLTEGGKVGVLAGGARRADDPARIAR